MVPSSRWFALLVGLTLALLVGCGALLYLVLSPSRALLGNTQELLDDPRVRRAVVSELVARSGGIFDSHPDPDVARVLQPRLEDVPYHGASVSSNGRGMPEPRDYALPKPEGTLRVVLLGDSFVFGYGVAQDRRTGAFLERHLRERLPDVAGPVECLHLAIGSWDAVAEAEYCRRQLSDLRPDLVVQLLIVNDLDDVTGVRGFGGRSDFVPRHPRRANGRVLRTWPVRYSERGNTNQLVSGLDRESRARWAEAGVRIERLAREVERQGGEYQLVVHWGNLNPAAHPFLEGRVRADRLLYLPRAFFTDRARYWLSADDSHFSERGHEAFAELLYGLIRVQELLDPLPAPWPEAEERAREALAESAGQVAEPPRYEHLPLLSRLDFTRVTAEVMHQVYGGVDDQGNAYPYASLLLKRDDGQTRVGVRIRCLERPEIDGARVRVHVEDHEVGQLEVRAGALLEETFPLPPELRERTFVNVRLEADDWVHAGPRGRQCWSYVLEGVALRR